jgi:hypothetical protein
MMQSAEGKFLYSSGTYLLQLLGPIAQCTCLLFLVPKNIIIVIRYYSNVFGSYKNVTHLRSSSLEKYRIPTVLQITWEKTGCSSEILSGIGQSYKIPALGLNRVQKVQNHLNETVFESFYFFTFRARRAGWIHLAGQYR